MAGEAGSALIRTFLADRLGRLRFMETMCVLVTLGVKIQIADANIGMFLAGRVLAGYAVVLRGHFANLPTLAANPVLGGWSPRYHLPK